jgi:hypothetical protein
MTIYDFAVNAFNSILGVKGKPFDSQKGVSDEIKGVQWNIAITENGEAKLGVNLEGMEYKNIEGMKYKNWPISTFLKEELDNPRLPSLAKVITDANKIHIKLDRDAWRVRKRPPIKEKNIEGSGTLLSELTDTVWSEMLKEAYDCLNSDKNHRGRAKQFVTLMPSGEVKEMEVSPHLGFKTIVWSSIPNSEEEAKSKLQEAFRRLRPLYDFVKETIGDLQTVTVYPDELDNPETLFEGIKKTVLVNSYERNPIARKKCIERYGAQCIVCDFDFEKVYGDIGKGFIHVHHLTKLSDMGQGYEVNPVKDLRPVCPNCHAMLHQKNPPYTIDELRLKRQS